MVPVGLELPHEARLWWGWHDGIEREDAEVLPARRELGPGFDFLPLAEAIELYDDQREMFATTGIEELRPAHLFPITYRNGPVSCDCSVGEGKPTPMFHIHSHDYDLHGATTPRWLIPNQ